MSDYKHKLELVSLLTSRNEGNRYQAITSEKQDSTLHCVQELYANRFFLILYPFLNRGFGNLARGIVTFVPAYAPNFMLISAIINKW